MIDVSCETRLVARLAAIFVVMLSAASAKAQAGQDRFSLVQTATTNASVGSDEGNWHSGEVAASSGPIPLARRFLISGGIAIAGAELDARLPIMNEGDRDLYNIRLSMMGIVPLNDRWSVAAGPVIGWAGDWGTFSLGKDVTLTGIAMASYRAGESRATVISFGVVASNAIPFSPVLPLINVSYRGNLVSTQIGFPVSSLYFNITERLALGAVASLDSPMYRVKATLEDGRAFDFTRISNYYAGPAAKVRLFSSLWLDLQGGVAFARQVQFYDSGRDQLEDSSIDVGTAAFARVGLAWRPQPMRPPSR